MAKLKSIKPSPRKDKKLVAEFDDGTKTHFGQKNASDFTQNKDEDKKENYLARHRPNENWNDYKSAGSLARHILWNKPTLEGSIRDYKKRFGV
jgi:hypothetical protein